MGFDKVKKRNWAFILYPESAPADWKDLLASTGLPIAISPLHEFDHNPDGEIKKAHHHVLLHYDGPTTYNVVNGLCRKLNQPSPQPIDSMRGQYRYLTHKDNPEKYQYQEADICRLNGFDIADFIEFSRSEVQSLIKKIHAFIRENDIYEYADLLDMLLDSDMFDEYEIATNHTIFVNAYITSRRNKAFPNNPRI